MDLHQIWARCFSRCRNSPIRHLFICLDYGLDGKCLHSMSKFLGTTDLSPDFFSPLLIIIPEVYTVFAPSLREDCASLSELWCPILSMCLQDVLLGPQFQQKELIFVFALNDQLNSNECKSPVFLSCQEEILNALNKDSTSSFGNKHGRALSGWHYISGNSSCPSSLVPSFSWSSEGIAARVLHGYLRHMLPSPLWSYSTPWSTTNKGKYNPLVTAMQYYQRCWTSTFGISILYYTRTFGLLFHRKSLTALREKQNAVIRHVFTLKYRSSQLRL